MLRRPRGSAAWFVGSCNRFGADWTPDGQGLRQHTIGTCHGMNKRLVSAALRAYLRPPSTRPLTRAYALTLVAKVVFESS